MVKVTWWNSPVDRQTSSGMRRPARLITWKTFVTPLLLLSSVLFNSAFTASNDTNNYDVSPLLALIASLRHRPDAILAKSLAAPRDAVVQPQLAELARLLVDERLRSANQQLSKAPAARSQLFPDRRESQPQEDGLTLPKTHSPLRRFFSPVDIFNCLNATTHQV